MDSFEVQRVKADLFVVDYEGFWVVVDDDPDRALKAMDQFIEDAQEAREALAELVEADDES